MKRSEIISKFNPNLSKQDLKSIEDYSRLDQRIEKQTQRVEVLDKHITKRTNMLKQRINELGIKINSALFGSKKFINESYAFEIPIKEDYFEPNESSVFKEGILTTKSEIFKNDNQLNLNITNITSRKNTDFKFVNNNLFIEENAYYNYQELEIKLPKTLVSGFLYLEFDTYNNISVLNSYGKEIVPKKVTNFIKQPISLKSKSIVLRFNNNSKKKIKILDFFVTQENFKLASVIETKPIAIKRNLTQIGLNTCDNYSSEDINIGYSISINNKPYTEIRPLNKQKNLNIHSIVSTDPELKMYKLDKGIYEEHQKLFLITDFETKSFNLIKSFKNKLGVEFGIVDTSRDIFINVIKDKTISIPKGRYIEVNGERVFGDENDKILLRKGVVKLRVSLDIWNQRHNLLEVEVLEVSGNKVKIKTKTGDISTAIVEGSLFYQLFDHDIFTEELESKVTFHNNKVYISREKETQAYVFIKEKTNYVNSIRVRIILKTSNKNIPPYISSLTLRGI